MEVKVLNNQSFLDIAIQVTGKVSNAMYIAKANELPVTTDLLEGQIIVIPDGLAYDTYMPRFYEKNTIEPATGLTQTTKDIITGCKGIGCWSIGIDFKIS
ncbi:conserved hypothetical protein [Tenacibaculum sp. 190524A02b]|uniref:LysM domain-containing protein n=1 Tax=Tenacibaculum vairaonense TaxID=3137860 RepID=A0ABM9PQW1_9FLAO